MPLPTVFDTNLVIRHIRQRERMPAEVVLPMVVVGELEAFALKADWGYQKVAFLRQLLERYPLVGFVPELAGLYARLDAYSQGRLRGQPVPAGLSARNMGKNDLWIAATALDLDMPLCTADRDFDHLTALGLVLLNEPLT